MTDRNPLKTYLWIALIVGLFLLPCAGCAGESRGFGLEVDIPIIGGSLTLGINEIKVDKHSSDITAPYFPRMLGEEPIREALDKAEGEALKMLEAIKARRAALPPTD